MLVSDCAPESVIYRGMGVWEWKIYTRLLHYATVDWWIYVGQ